MIRATASSFRRISKLSRMGRRTAYCQLTRFQARRRFTFLIFWILVSEERETYTYTHTYTHTHYIYIYIHTHVWVFSIRREEERRDEMESKREIRSGSLWKEEAIRRRGKKKRVTAKYRALPPVQIPWTQLSETVSLINLTFRVCYRESPFFLTVPRLNWSPSDRFFFFLSSFFFFSLLS